MDFEARGTPRVTTGGSGSKPGSIPEVAELEFPKFS